MRFYFAYFLFSLMALSVALLFPQYSFDVLALMISAAYFYWGWEKALIALLILSFFFGAFSLLNPWQIALPYAIVILVFRLFFRSKLHFNRIDLLILLSSFILTNQLLGSFFVFKNLTFFKGFGFNDLVGLLSTLLVGILIIPFLLRLPITGRRLRSIRMQQLDLFSPSTLSKRRRTKTRKPFGWN